jgi:hypothetical protein
MKTKQILILLGVLAVLVVLVLIVANPFRVDEHTKKIETAQMLFPNFDKESITQIEITAAGETTTLKKENDQWVVSSMDNYPADSEGIGELLDKVAGFKKVVLRSKNPEKQSSFQVDSTGTEAKLLDSGGNPQAHVFVGTTTQSYLSSYIRAADSDHVYVAAGYLKSIFDKGTRTWKDRTIFDFNKGDVMQMNIKSETEEIELQLGADGKWQMLNPTVASAKQTEIDSLLGKLSALDADDFAEPKEDLAEYELQLPKSSIVATLNDGSKKTLLIGKEEGGKHYVKREDKAQIFMLFKSNIDQLTKKSEDLKDDTPTSEPSAEIDSETVGTEP